MSSNKRVDLEDRVRLYIHEMKQGEFLPGQKAYEKLLRSNRNEAITGTVAVSGKVMGRVNIVLNISHISKFKAGDVLVAPFTNVNYLPIMRQAKAILTETGGLTSHAAIVARELGVPCVIATDNATRVIKDNDLLELDARKGVIKIVKRVR